MADDLSHMRLRRLRATHLGLMVVAVWMVFMLTGCGKQRDAQDATTKPASKTAATPKQFAYGAWSDWQLDCSKRAADLNLPCAAVRKRVCEVVNTTGGTAGEKPEGVACEHCGGQCREEVADEKGSPRHFYAAWSEWQSSCNTCDAQPKTCKAERTRNCVDRVVGRATDCEFCGGACKEQEARVSGCSPECKSTTVHSYSDQACTIRNRDDIFAGPWGPQTGSPFNSGCSETQATEKCVKFGRNYYQWDRCAPGCVPTPKP